jgi:cell division protein FtsQ
MEQKRKISIRKILQVLLTLLVTGGCIVALLSASRIEDNKHLAGMEVHISNGSKYHFLDDKQVMDMVVNNRHLDINHIPLNKLDIRTMENIVASNPWVANAEAFIDNKHVLQLYVTQRVPVVRVFEKEGGSYYLDAMLSEMPLSDNYVHYTAVVTNVPELKDDSTGRSFKTQIVTLVKFIERDTFWNAQVSQIIMDSNSIFEFVPVMGSQRVIIGDTSRLKDKFENLMIFYKKVMNRIGWDKYEVLDLRYKGQVVASPSLPWKGPVDKTMSSMSWVKSIIDSSARVKDDKIDTGHVKSNVPPVKIVQALSKKDARPVANSKTGVKKELLKVNKANTNKANTNKDNNKQKSPKYIYH